MFRSCWILQSRDSTSIHSVATPTNGQDGTVTIEGGRMGFWPHGDHTLWSMGIHGNYLDIQAIPFMLLRKVCRNIYQDVIGLPKNARRLQSVFSKYVSIEVYRLSVKCVSRRFQHERMNQLPLPFLLEENDWVQVECRGPSYWWVSMHNVQTGELLAA